MPSEVYQRRPAEQSPPAGVMRISGYLKTHPTRTMPSFTAPAPPTCRGRLSGPGQCRLTGLRGVGGGLLLFHPPHGLEELLFDLTAVQFLDLAVW